MRCISISHLKKAKHSVECSHGSLYFIIDPNRRHPGLADRLKAIINLYNEAKFNGLKFKIIYKTPFCLEKFLTPALPNIIDWPADYNELIYSLTKTRLVNEHKEFHLKNVKPGKQYQCYNYTGDIIPYKFENTGYKWHELFEELFKPNDEITRFINATGFQPRKYVAVQIRFVNAFDNFEKGFGNHIDNEEKRADLINRCHKAIKQIAIKSKKSGIDDILVFSDSKTFLCTLDELPVKTLDSANIGHISFSNNHDQIIKTFVDFFMIGKAAHVYHIVSKEMYQSSCFALTAAMAANTEYTRIEV